MKTRIFKAVMPLMAIAFAVFGTFAFTSAPEESALMDINGVLPSSCAETQIVCKTENTGEFCKNASNVELWRLNAQGTACPTHVYRKF